MPYRITPLVNKNFYHVFNRGVEKRKVFSNDKDYQRFIDTLYYYQFSGPKPSFSQYRRFKNKSFESNTKIVEIVAYCLMPNHFHLLLKQLKDGGITEFVSKISNSYTKFFNTKHSRVGPLLQGQFKAVLVENDEQLTHLSRYIHINPYVAELVKDPAIYKYSSYSEYIGKTNRKLCFNETIMSFFKSPEEYKKFVGDHEDYALRIEQMKHLLIEDE